MVTADAPPIDVRSIVTDWILSTVGRLLASSRMTAVSVRASPGFASPGTVWVPDCAAAETRTGNGREPVAAKTTPGSPAPTAETTLVPGAASSVRVELACPNASVVVAVFESVPPPVVISKMTVAPATGRPKASSTETTNGFARVAPTFPDWPLPEATRIAAGAFAVAVAAKATGEPTGTEAVAFTVTDVDPSVRTVCACPL